MHTQKHIKSTITTLQLNSNMCNTGLFSHSRMWDNNTENLTFTEYLHQLCLGQTPLVFTYCEILYLQDVGTNVGHVRYESDRCLSWNMIESARLHTTHVAPLHTSMNI